MMPGMPKMKGLAEGSKTGKISDVNRSITDKAKIHKVMSEFKVGSLHSGSKRGPRVTKRKQAIAIALSEARKAAEGGINPRPPKRVTWKAPVNPLMPKRKGKTRGFSR